MKIIIQSKGKSEENTTINPRKGILKELFNKLMHEENSNVNSLHWINDSEVVFNELPSPALHNFLLLAEKLGSKIEFKRVTVIKID